MSSLIRPATTRDFDTLQTLLNKGGFLHNHLDWHEPTDWLGTQPFFVLEVDLTIRAFIACPQLSKGIAWIHSFFCLDPAQLYHSWGVLLQEVIEFYRCGENTLIAAIPLSTWFEIALNNSSFKSTQKILNLYKEPNPSACAQISSAINISTLEQSDLEQVIKIDHAAFPLLWQLPDSSLLNALSSAYSAKAVSIEGTVVAYQISTFHQRSVHLARIAVLPEKQHMGIASAMIYDLERQCKRDGILRITLNTQNDNLESLALYRRVGFIFSGEQYPVYTREIS